MRRRVVAVAVLLGVALVALLGLTYIQRARAAQALIYSVNNARELSQFATLSGTDPARRGRDDFRATPGFMNTADKLRELGVAPEVPAGTVYRADLPPDRRLSWIGPLLPTLDPKRIDGAALFARLDLMRAWDEGPNREVAAVPLAVTVSYAKPPETPPGSPAVTQFVGMAGLGADAPTLPPTRPADPRAGCFRYDGPTPFDAVADGLSQTILLGEVSMNLGPWLQGGPATVRPLLTAPGSPPPLGFGGQFGGNHAAGAILGFADHSVRVFSPRTDPAVLASLCTIDGGATALPGE
jgi:hypothetical protein